MKSSKIKSYSSRRVFVRLLQGSATALAASGLALAIFATGLSTRLRDSEFLFEPQSFAPMQCVEPQPVAEPEPALLPEKSAVKAPVVNQKASPSTPVNLTPRPPSPDPLVAEALAPPVEDYFEFSVDLPAGQVSQGKTETDFLAASTLTNVRFEIMKADYIVQLEETILRAKPTAIALLFDQSASIMLGDNDTPGSDPSGLRLKAGVDFASNLPSSIKLGVFAYGEPDENAPGEMRAGFSSSRENVKRAIWGLRGKEGGITLTFTALYNVMNQMVKSVPSSDKIVICFTDGDALDTDASPYILHFAKRHRISIHFVALGDGAHWDDYHQLSSATGGELVWVQNASQLNDAFANLKDQIVKSDASFYRLTIRAAKQGSPFTPGERLLPKISVKDTALLFRFNVDVH